MRCRWKTLHLWESCLRSLPGCALDSSEQGKLFIETIDLRLDRTAGADAVRADMRVDWLAGKAFALEKVPSFCSGRIQHNDTWAVIGKLDSTRVTGKIAVSEPHQSRCQALMKLGEAASLTGRLCRGLYRWTFFTLTDQVCSAEGVSHRWRQRSPNQRPRSRNGRGSSMVFTLMDFALSFVGTCDGRSLL